MFFLKKNSKHEPKSSTNNLIKLEKWNVLGNDFLLSESEFTLDQIIKLSDRKFGIGCDQFVVIKGKNIKFYNQDGSESKMCGNALKCITQKIFLESGEREFFLNTGINPIKCFINKDGLPEILLDKPKHIEERANPFLHLQNIVSSQKNDINYDFLKLVQRKENQFYFVDVGNPHLICIFDLSTLEGFLGRELGETFLSSKTIDFIFNYLGEYIQKEFLKTAGVNFSIVIPEPKSVLIRTFERGVGETLSCGSAAVSAIFSLVRAQVFQHDIPIKIFSKGSEKIESLKESFSIIIINGDNTISFSGIAKKIGEISLTNL